MARGTKLDGGLGLIHIYDKNVWNMKLMEGIEMCGRKHSGSFAFFYSYDSACFS